MLIAQGAAAFAAGQLLNFTPCVLPVIPLKIRVLLAGIDGGAGARALVALPYLLLLCFPGWLRRLPQNGPVGQQVKALLGFVLIGGAVFFSKPLLPPQWSSWLWRTLAVAVTLWALRALWRDRGGMAKLVPGQAIALLLFLREAMQPFWRPYSEEALAAARHSRRPVLLEHHGGRALPYAVVVDRSGRRLKSFSGLFSAEALLEALAEAEAADAER